MVHNISFNYHIYDLDSLIAQTISHIPFDSYLITLTFCHHSFQIPPSSLTSSPNHVYHNPSSHHPRSPLEISLPLTHFQTILAGIRLHIPPTSARVLTDALYPPSALLHLPWHVGRTPGEQTQRCSSE